MDVVDVVACGHPMVQGTALHDQMDVVDVVDVVIRWCRERLYMTKWIPNGCGGCGHPMVQGTALHDQMDSKWMWWLF